MFASEKVDINKNAFLRNSPYKKEEAYFGLPHVSGYESKFYTTDSQ